MSGVVDDLRVEGSEDGLLKFLKKELGHCGFRVLSSEVSEFLLSPHLNPLCLTRCTLFRAL